jgi:hypothetical protein
MLGDIEMQEAAAVMREDNKDIQDSQLNRLSRLRCHEITVSGRTITERRLTVGASAIKCWQSSCNSCAWYSLRLKLSAVSSAFPRVHPTMKSPNCPNKHCSPSAKRESRTTVRHGFYKTKWGKRRRHRCQTCGRTFCSANGTPYYRLQHRRATFDEVAILSVEGVIDVRSRFWPSRDR